MHLKEILGDSYGCCGSRSSGFEDFKTSLQLKHSIILSIGMVVMALQDLLEYLTQSALWMSKQTRESYSHWNFKAKSSWPTGPWNFRKPLLCHASCFPHTAAWDPCILKSIIFLFNKMILFSHEKIIVALDLLPHLLTLSVCTTPNQSVLFLEPASFPLSQPTCSGITLLPGHLHHLFIKCQLMGGQRTPGDHEVGPIYWKK